MLKDPINKVGGDKAVTIGDVITDYYGMKQNGNVDRIKVISCHRLLVIVINGY